jgi:hypothetical protein
MIRMMVGELHVSASNRDVIRLIRSKLNRDTRTGRARRKMRHAYYRQALRQHEINAKLYVRVMSGAI